MSRTTRNRTCVKCGGLYEEPVPWPYAWAKIYCSQDCSRRLRKAISPASTEQRAAIDTRACVVCRGHAGHCHPAHLVDKSLADDELLDLLPYLEPHFRVELAYAVERFGLLRTWRRVTNRRGSPDEHEAAA